MIVKVFCRYRGIGAFGAAIAIAIPGICNGAEKCSTALALIFVGYTLDRIQCFWSIFESGSSRLQNRIEPKFLFVIPISR